MCGGPRNTGIYDKRRLLKRLVSADVVAVYTFIEKGSESGFTREAADVNRDGSVNTADVVAIYTAIIGSEGAGSRAFKKQILRLLNK